MGYTLNIRQYYRELGKLLYAIAITDSRSKQVELYELHEFVTKEMSPTVNISDSSVINKEFYTFFEFEECVGKQMYVKEAHCTFVKFLDANILEIDPLLIDKSIRAIENAVTAFRKMNRKEMEQIRAIKKDIIDIVNVY